MRATYTFGSGTYDDQVTVSGEQGSKAGTIELAFEYARDKITLERHNAEALHAALTLLLNLTPDGGYISQLPTKQQRYGLNA